MPKLTLDLPSGKKTVPFLRTKSYIYSL